MDGSTITCDDIIDADAEAKSKNKETKINFNEKKQPVKHKISIFFLHFCELL